MTACHTSKERLESGSWVAYAPISLKKAAFGNWHEGAALIHSGR